MRVDKVSIIHGGVFVKAIILAAGQGTRLKKYTKALPKGMLSFAGKTLIERQIEAYRAAGIQKIIIVRGFAADKIAYDGVTYYTNDDFATTNMVESLLAAQTEFDDDIIVSYSDILFERRLLDVMMREKADFAVAVDDAWQDYWRKRYGEVDFDTESLRIDLQGNIIELGKEAPPLSEIDARYIGLLKFSRNGMTYMSQLVNDAKEQFENEPWQQSGKPVRQAYMTDLLNAVIEAGKSVKAVRFQHGWIEFDTNEDYENAIRWNEIGELDDIVRL